MGLTDVPITSEAWQISNAVETTSLGGFEAIRLPEIISAKFGLSPPCRWHLLMTESTVIAPACSRA
jgi:hypothetical protein